MNSVILFSFVVIALYFLAFFILGNLIKNNSIVDMGWGAGFVLVGWSTLFYVQKFDFVSVLLVILVSIWGTRLSHHLVKRNLHKGEDYRYVNMRKKWGNHALIGSLINVYLMQALMMALISYGYVYAISWESKMLSAGTFVGLCVWLIGFFFEVVGDRQLRSFIANKNKEKTILDTGLWHYTRHPNYFGEATLWWGIYIIVLSSTGNIFAIISPIVITVLVRYISGVPLLEKSMMQNPDFQKYAKITSVFFPLPPKK